MTAVQFEQRRQDGREASILPLINVVFLLLIFFMVAGSLSVTEPFKVDAPQSISEGTKAAEPMRLLLGSDGQLALDGQLMDEGELLAEVRLRLEADAGLRVQLKADANTVGNRVVLLMEGLRQAGVERLHLLTLPPSP